jgi:hypothetical protein
MFHSIAGRRLMFIHFSSHRPLVTSHSVTFPEILKDTMPPWTKGSTQPPHAILRAPFLRRNTVRSARSRRLPHAGCLPRSELTNPRGRPPGPGEGSAGGRVVDTACGHRSSRAGAALLDEPPRRGRRRPCALPFPAACLAAELAAEWPRLSGRVEDSFERPLEGGHALRARRPRREAPTPRRPHRAILERAVAARSPRRAAPCCHRLGAPTPTTDGWTAPSPSTSHASRASQARDTAISRNRSRWRSPRKDRLLLGEPGEKGDDVPPPRSSGRLEKHEKSSKIGTSRAACRRSGSRTVASEES